jgi:hypothetical protein
VLWSNNSFERDGETVEAHARSTELRVSSAIPALSTKDLRLRAMLGVYWGGRDDGAGIGGYYGLGASYHMGATSLMLMLGREGKGFLAQSIGDQSWANMPSYNGSGFTARLRYTFLFFGGGED